MMASFAVEGLAELTAAFEKGSQVPDEVKNNVLIAMANVAADALKKTGTDMEIRDEDNQSGIHILDSIKIKKPKLTDDGGSIIITFTGSRTRGNTKTRNAEIAFINEFGANARGIEAKQWIAHANESCEEEAIKAGQAVLDAWIETL